jgi:MFS family permease
LIATIGASKVLWFDAASFAISALIFGVFVTDVRHVPEKRGSFMDDVWEGVRFLFQDKALRAILVAATVSNFLFTPLFSVALPVYAKDTYGHASDLGIMFASVAAGAIAGALAYGIVGARLNKRFMIVFCFALFAFPFFVLVASPPLPIVAAAMFVVGIGSGTLNPLAITLLQERSPAEMRARILGAVTAIAMAASPLGALIGGTLVSALSATAVIVGISVASLAVTVWLGAQSALAELDDPTTLSPAQELS